MSSKRPDHLILLMPELEAEFFSNKLVGLRPNLSLHRANSLDRLKEIMAQGLENTALVAFLTGVIVPEAVLNNLIYALNIHPGPPTRPGYRPTAQIEKEGAQDLGATLHFMIAEVDAGPIIAVQRTTTKQNSSLEQIESLTYNLALRLAQDHMSEISGIKDTIIDQTERWGST